jgi:hypothetical protein
MTSNGLDRTELHRIQADGEREVLRLESRLQAIIEKLLAMRGEVEDGHTCQIVLHLGRRGDVKADLQKRY